MSSQSLTEAIVALVTAQTDYASVQATATAHLSEARVRRETAMRAVAARGLSHRRIAELTDLSHTRVNQILGAGTKMLPVEAHLPPGFLGPPSKVPIAAIRVMAEQGSRVWTIREIASDLTARGWPRDDLESELMRLVTDGVILSVDGGAFTLHSYGQSA